MHIPLRTSYIASVVEGGLIGTLAYNCFTTSHGEKTKEIHGMLIGHYLEEIDDWQVLESIASKGPATGLLKKDYLECGRTVEIYRHTNPRAVAASEKVYANFHLMSRDKYDFKEIVIFCLQALVYFLKHRKKPIPTEFDYFEDRHRWCWEAVNSAYAKAGFRLIPIDIRPDPWSIAEAVHNGRLEWFCTLLPTGKAVVHQEGATCAVLSWK